MPIHFHIDDVAFKLKQPAAIKRWLKASILAEQHQLGTINYIFCSDERLLEINKQFLQHDYYTDIITFDNTIKNIVQGELYISIDRIKEHSNKYKVSEEEELHRVMVHGILHLLGYKDKSKKDSAMMRSKENEHLNQLIIKLL